MLGINAPKVLAKGKYAQAVRKAALASIGAKAKKDDDAAQQRYKHRYKHTQSLDSAACLLTRPTHGIHPQAP